jgi:cytoskeleton protein RodZ
MITESEQTQMTETNRTSFGAQLKSSREALGLEIKDIAAQLRLNENVIIMLEQDEHAPDLPVTFLRGYIRAYGRLLHMPEQAILDALEPIQPKPSVVTTAPLQQAAPLTSGNYLVQIFTYLMLFTVVGLVGSWWYTHSSSTNQTTASNQISIPAIEKPKPVAAATPTTPTPPAIKTTAIAASVNLGVKTPVAAPTPAPTIETASAKNDSSDNEDDNDDEPNTIED